jgi:hypothetical protein
MRLESKLGLLFNLLYAFSPIRLTTRDILRRRGRKIERERNRERKKNRERKRERLQAR